MEIAVPHIPVLLDKALDLLQVRRKGIYVDCTTGSGGHSEEILDRLGNTGQLIAVDRDMEAVETVKDRLGLPLKNVHLFHENFKNLPIVLRRLNISEIDGCLLDLGVSSGQLDSPERGFSFRHDGPLDMRMDDRQSTTAANLVNQLSQQRLAEVFAQYGEEKSAQKIASEVVQRRKIAKFRTTQDLAELVAKIKGTGGRIHPATKVFQALRIEVNQELIGLEKFLHQVVEMLALGARLVVISFHSLEDRIVKTTFQKESGKCVCFLPGELCSCPRTEHVRILTKKPVSPTAQEINMNLRSRSAKLRTVEKIQIKKIEKPG